MYFVFLFLACVCVDSFVHVSLCVCMYDFFFVSPHSRELRVKWARRDTASLLTLH